tara:strand:+ start:243 stop:434 length:192 start_codon:yes stop_codon:yes gene_type:complete
LPVNAPAKLTIITVSGELTTIGAAVQAALRAGVAQGAELYAVQYVRNAQKPNRVTAYILFEAP